MVERLSLSRAKAALMATENLRTPNPNEEEKRRRADYRRAAESLPADIHICCLGPALAMLLSNEKDGARQLFDDLVSWLFENWPYAETPSGRYDGDRSAALNKLVNATQVQYLALKTEALEYSGWLKRFAEAFIGKDEDFSVDV